MRRIGIYSGTFDPVHAGHVAFCEAAMKTCGLDEVFLLPERNPRGKRGVTDIEKREAWLQAATSYSPALRVMTLAPERFTVAETLPELRRLFAGAELTLLMGSDIVRTLPYRWEGLEELFNEMSLAVGMREPDTHEDIEAVLKQLEYERKILIRSTLLTTDYGTVSSTQLRGALRMRATS